MREPVKYFLVPSYLGADCQTYEIWVPSGEPDAEGVPEIVPSASLEITHHENNTVTAKVCFGLASTECEVCEAEDVIENYLELYAT